MRRYRWESVKSPMSTYEELDTLLQRKDKRIPSRKVGNNTYAQRRDHRIAIRLHGTDILLFEYNQLDGTPTITLDSGGWLTVTTKERMNRFLPKGVSVSSVKGRWYVHLPGRDDFDTTRHVLYQDGMKLTRGFLHAWVTEGALRLEEKAKQDTHNKLMEKLISKWLKGLKEEHLQSWNDTPCPMCICVHTPGEGLSLVGELMEDTQHLIEHLMEGAYPYNLLTLPGRRLNNRGVRHTMLDLVKVDVRAYLRSQLIIGPITIRGAHRAA